MKILNKYIRELPELEKDDVFILLSFYNILLHTKQEVKVKIKFEIDSDDFIYIHLSDIKIDYLGLLKYLFPSCKITDCQTPHTHNKVKGYPDFELIGSKGDKFFIEVKNGSDSLSESQLSFAYDNKNSFIMFIKNIKEEFIPNGDYNDDWLEDNNNEENN